MNRAINIQSVKVPNPLAMKFEAPELLLTPGAYQFNSKEEAANSPLALKLFGFDYVERVFIAKNFVTVTKKTELPAWEGVMVDHRIMIKKHLEDGEPIFDFEHTAQEEPVETASETEGVIRKLIAEQIAPATWHDGGEITFDSFEDGVVRVRLAGACIRCPFASRTVKHGIEVLLQRYLPDEVKEVTTVDVDWAETQQEA